MISDYRMLQVFLNPTTGGVSEVSFRESAPPHFTCTCPSYKPGGSCPHTAFVASRLRATGGVYPYPRVDPALLAKAVSGTAEDFREFVLRYRNTPSTGTDSMPKVVATYMDSREDESMRKRRLAATSAAFATKKAASLAKASATMVQTPTGWSMTADLNVGSKVIGSNGHATKVLAVTRRPDEQLYRVTADDGGSIVVDAAHAWTLAPPGQLRRSVTSRQLQDVLVTNSRRYAHLPVVAPVQYAASATLPIDPWLLGVLIGDGCLTNLTPQICKPDEWLHQEVGRVLPPGVEHHWITRSRGMASLVGTTADHKNPLTRLLREAGLMGAHSWEKVIPPAYMTASVDDREALLAGLLDTDGGVESKGVTFCTTSGVLALQVQELVWSLGGTARLKDKPFPRFQGGGIGRPAWVVRLRLGDNPFHLPRKRLAYFQRGAITPRPPSRRVIAVEAVGRGDVVCLQVAAPDGLYVTTDFLLTQADPPSTARASRLPLKPGRKPKPQAVPLAPGTKSQQPSGVRLRQT